MQAIIYEITASIREDLIDSFEDFMVRHHIPDLMATGCFSGATFSRSEPDRYRITYQAYDRESLDEYLSKHAPELREQVLDTFPEGLEIARQEWDLVATF